MPNILVVADNAAALEATVTVLRQAGYEVAAAGNGAEALGQVRTLCPALVLLDVVLPDLSGLDVIREIRADPALVGVSVVLLSSMRSTAEERAAGLDAGADDYIARPIANTEMLARVRAQLRQHDVKERLRASEQQLRESIGEVGDLKAALDQHSIVAITDARGRITFVNDKFCDISKYSRAELLGQDHRILNSGYHPKEFIRELWTTISRGEVWQGELRNRAKDGSLYWLATTIVPFLNADGKPRQYVAIRTDISPIKLHEQELARLSRLYDALSQVNQAIVRLPARDELFRRVCEVLVEKGRLCMAWIGWHDPETQLFSAVSHYGDEGGYLQHLKLYGAEQPEAPRPTGTALRTGMPYICNDMINDDAMLPWRAAILIQGFRAAAGLPIRLQGVIRGTLNVYSKEPGFFQDKEVALLMGVAADVSFGLDNLEREHERKRAEEDSARARERLSNAQRIGGIGDWEFDLSTGAITWSPQTFELFGRDPRLGPPKNYDENAALFEPASAALMEEKVSAAIGTGETQEYELVANRTDGQRVPLLAIAAPRKDGTGKVVGLVGTVQDVSAHKRAERLVRESEERLSFATEAAQIGSWDMDLRTNAARRSLIHDQCFGYTEMQPSWGYETFLAHVQPADRDRVDAAFRTAMAGKGEYDQEFRAPWPDGSEHWLWTRGQFYFDETGHPYRVAGIVVDISERRRAAEAALRLAAIVEFSDDAIVGVDLSGIVSSWNAGAAALYGYAAEEMIAQPILRIIPPERHSEHATLLAQILRGEAVRNFETVRRRKDGSTVDISLTVSAIRDATGKIVGVSKMAHDVTERKQAEAAVRDSEERLRVALEAAEMGTWDLDMATDTAVRSLRHDEIFGYRELQPEWGVEIALRNVLPEDRPIIQAAFARALDTGLLAFDARVCWRDGSTHWIAAHGRAMHDGQGRPVRIIGVVADITARKRAEESIQLLNTTLEQRIADRTAQLEAANQELEAFSYSVSHDLRAPLRAVDGYSQAVLEDFGPQLPDEGRRQLQTIRNSAQRMGELIDDLLRFSRLGRLSMNVQEVPTATLVRAALADLRDQYEGRRIEIKVGELPPCEGDRALLKQVWMNLLSNALKYSGKREHAIVEIGCVEEKGERIYFVRDNGAGFDMRYADKLFGVFQRLHRATEFEGTGVGLAIVQRIVKRHGGRIWAEAAVDRGATFYFTLKGPHAS